MVSISLSNESMVEDDKSKIPLYNKFTSKIFKKHFIHFIVTILNSMKFLQNSSNMNLKTTKRKYVNKVFIQIEMCIISPFKKKVSIIQIVINKPYIMRDVLDTSNINGVIILNI
ncbi:hypothetical protein H8356DRAFT_1323732 [Neocallimastix lanati (nom. inval.)]|nr:hypothetical protein H8356DRAFT_1323732 [Neocallimastix sp. JGI-2020a]